MWFLAQNGEIAISLNVARERVKNLQTEPNCALLILDLVDPYRYLEIRGKAAEDRDDFEFACKVGHKYGADLREYDVPGIDGSSCVSFRCESGQSTCGADVAGAVRNARVSCKFVGESFSLRMNPAQSFRTLRGQAESRLSAVSGTSEWQLPAGPAMGAGRRTRSPDISHRHRNREERLLADPVLVTVASGDDLQGRPRRRRCEPGFFRTLGINDADWVKSTHSREECKA